MCIDGSNMISESAQGAEMTNLSDLLTKKYIPNIILKDSYQKRTAVNVIHQPFLSNFSPQTIHQEKWVR